MNLSTEKLFKVTDKLLLAVSGGVDSVILCELCHRAGLNFAIAHVNFQLRGEESEGDEQFVKTLASKYNVQLFVKKVDTVVYAEENKLSIQVAARELRYDWFKELLITGFDWLLTAHHRDDNIETVLMNFFRGTGIGGLHGILPVKENIVRPLLNYSKEEIIAFAKQNNLQWREDSSNQSDKYARNYFRQAIVPLVAKIFPEAEQNIAANITRFRDIELLYNQAIGQHKRKLIDVKGQEIHVPILKLKQAAPLATIIYEIVRPYSFSSQQVPDIISLLDAEQGKLVQSSTHRIIKNRNWLIIAAKQSLGADMVIIEEGEQFVDFANGTISINANKDGEKFDAGSIKYPLILRKWKQGDYFYPLGMPKKKKVARFLIDNKVSPTQKENTWVLESDKRICWIVGMRIDDRFKIKESTKDILYISYSDKIARP